MEDTAVRSRALAARASHCGGGGGGRSWPLPGDSDEWVGSQLQGVEGQRPSSHMCMCDQGSEITATLEQLGAGGGGGGGKRRYPTLSEGQKAHGASGMLTTPGRSCRRMQRAGWRMQRAG